MLVESKMVATQITKLACLQYQFLNWIFVSIVRFLMAKIDYLNDHRSWYPFWCHFWSSVIQQISIISSRVTFLCNVGDIPGASEDAVLQYSRAVMWEGLKDMVARDAIRENDGPAMISLWAMENVSFQDRGHNKYLIIGHRLLSSRLSLSCP